MRMVLPSNVKNIIETLQTNGHEAYAVGGCVRDCILGKIPHDWDITTSAKPEEVKALFPKTFDTGIEHGTVTVLMGKEGYEVTTYRIDGKYSDGRHPDKVQFTASLEEDLKRRDFTINAMAYNDSEGLVDIFGGMEDLDNKIIRAVGVAEERFTEDALRMLRAMRFAAQLGFEIHEDTYTAVKKLAPTLKKVSAERIQVELVKLLTSNHPEQMIKVYETGLTKVFLPEFDIMMATEQNCAHHCYTVGMHTVEALKNIPNDRVLRITMLLHDVAKPKCKTTDADGVDHFKKHQPEGAVMAKEILQRLKFDNDTINRVCKFIKYHDERPLLNEKAIRRAIVKIGPENFPEFFSIRRADTLAQSMYMRQEKLDDLLEFERIYQEIIDASNCLSLKELAVSGRDLIEMGVPQGAKIGEILSILFDEVIENPEKNSREYLLSRMKELL